MDDMLLTKIMQLHLLKIYKHHYIIRIMVLALVA